MSVENIDDILARGLPLDEMFEQVNQQLDDIGADLVRTANLATLEDVRSEIINLYKLDAESMMHDFTSQLERVGIMNRRLGILHENGFIEDAEYNITKTVLDDAANHLINSSEAYSIQVDGYIAAGEAKADAMMKQETAIEGTMAQDKLDAAKKEMDEALEQSATVRKSLDAAEAAADAAKEAADAAKTAWQFAKSRGAPESEIAKLEHTFEIEQAGFAKQSKLVEDIRKGWNKFEAAATAKATAFNETMEAAKKYIGLGKYDPTAPAFRKIASTIDDIIAPIRKGAQGFRRAGDVLFDGYQKYIESFI